MNKFSNFDITKNDLSSLMGNDKADIFYCDPPWGLTHLKYFQTINFKQNNIPVQNVDLNIFLDSFFGLITKYSRNISFVEYGVKWKDLIIKYTNDFGLKHLSCIDIVYGSKNLPLHLHIIAKEEIKIDSAYIKSVTNTKSINTVLNATRPFIVKDGIVLDPCCGLGNSGKMALQFNMKFRGNEFNKARLERTIRLFKKEQFEIV